MILCSDWLSDYDLVNIIKLIPVIITVVTADDNKLLLQLVLTLESGPSQVAQI